MPDDAPTRDDNAAMLAIFRQIRADGEAASLGMRKLIAESVEALKSADRVWLGEINEWYKQLGIDSREIADGNSDKPERPTSEGGATAPVFGTPGERPTR